MSEELRKSLDSNDQFFGGHKIVKTLKYPRKTSGKWAENDVEVQKLLLRIFPKLKTSSSQRQSAGRWLRIIQLYFKLEYTQGQIAEEMSETVYAVKAIIRRVRLAMAGYNPTKKKRRGARGYQKDSDSISED